MPTFHPIWCFAYFQRLYTFKCVIIMIWRRFDFNLPRFTSISIHLSIHPFILYYFSTNGVMKRAEVYWNSMRVKRTWVTGDSFISPVSHTQHQFLSQACNSKQQSPAASNREERVRKEASGHPVAQIQLVEWVERSRMQTWSAKGQNTEPAGRPS